jgi:hypothetical protein
MVEYQPGEVIEPILMSQHLFEGGKKPAQGGRASVEPDGEGTGLDIKSVVGARVPACNAKKTLVSGYCNQHS